ncbi:hypothetical protein CaCOL14_008590 [Colletotrichum acutatum]
MACSSGIGIPALVRKYWHITTSDAVEQTCKYGFGRSATLALAVAICPVERPPGGVHRAQGRMAMRAAIAVVRPPQLNGAIFGVCY